MSTQLIIRINPKLKENISKLAKREGKTVSELIRELLENYIKERDMKSYIDNLWNRIGKKLSENNISENDIEKAIKEIRANNA